MLLPKYFIRIFSQALIPNRSALLTSFSSFNVLFNSTFDKISDFFIFLFGSPATTPNRSCLFLICSSISAFFITVEDDWPNLSARFFKVSKSADGAAPILVAVLVVRPNLSARDCFLLSEVNSEAAATAELASKRAARAAARSASVHFLMVISPMEESFLSLLTLVGLSVDAGASILVVVTAGDDFVLSRLIATFFAAGVVGAGTTISSSSSPSSSLASSNRSVSLLGSASSVAIANCNLSIKSCLTPVVVSPLAFRAFFKSVTVIADKSISKA